MPSSRRDVVAPCRSRTIAAVAVPLLSLVAPAWAANPKRGFGSGDVARIQSVNSSWYYNWGTGKANTATEFVPMIWGGWAANDATINAIKADPSITTVLGFNEPERPDQANMSVTAALDAWPKLMQSGKRLVSPGVSDTAEGRAWLQSFMTGAAARGYQVDAVAFHWYGDVRSSNAASNFLNAVSWYHTTFNKPVWITEFGGLDWYNNPSNPVTMAQNLTFMQQALPALDARSYVERYAWWNWSSITNLVVDPAPLTTTALGDYWTGTTYSTGQTFDLKGKDTGSDIYYLKGGTVTNTAPTRDDAMRRLDVVNGTGTITGAGRWELRDTLLRVRNGATLRKTGSNLVALNDIAIVNDGTVSVTAGTLQFEDGAHSTGAGSFRVETGGTLGFSSSTAISDPNSIANGIDLRGGTLQSANFVQTVAAPVTLTSASTVETVGQLDLTGPITGAAALTKTGAGVLRITSRSGTTMSGPIAVQQGTLFLDKSGSSVTGTSAVNVAAQGRLIGAAIVNGPVTVSGELSPGNLVPGSAGELRFASTLTLASTAATSIDLAALESDRLTVTGTATLGGTLNLTLAGGFSPAALEPITVLTAGTLSGKFDRITGVSVSPRTSLAVIYVGGSVRVVPTLPGDIDLSGAVDFADLLTMAQRYATAGTSWAEGDLDGDGATGFGDLLTLAQNYGGSLAAPGARSAERFAADWAMARSLVPEPGAIAVLAIPAALLVRRRRRDPRRSQRA